MEESKSELVFTPAGLLDLLAQIDELQGNTLSITETLDGGLQLSVGESYYIIDVDQCATEVSAPDNVIEEVGEANEVAYDEMGNDVEGLDLSAPEIQDVVEGGIVKELAKTLLVGGVVRLGKELLTD